MAEVDLTDELDTDVQQREAKVDGVHATVPKKKFTTGGEIEQMKGACGVTRTGVFVGG